MKKFLTSVLLAAVILSVTACGNGEKETASEKEVSAQQQENNEGLKGLFESRRAEHEKEDGKSGDDDEESANKETDDKEDKKSNENKKKSNLVSPEDAKVSEDWEDMMFSIDGNVFALPFPYGALATQGWEIETKHMDSDCFWLNPGDKKLVWLKNENFNTDFSLDVSFVNRSDEVLEIRECDIDCIDINCGWGGKIFDNIPEIEIANGIKPGCSLEDVKAVYGEPEYVYESDDYNYVSVRYEFGSLANVLELTFYKETGLARIGLSTVYQNPCMDIDYDIDESLITFEQPEYEKEEKHKKQERDKLSDDWTDMEFSLEGEIFAIPEYFEFLADEGWVITSENYKNGYILNPKETISSIRLNNKKYSNKLSFRVNMVNTSDNIKDILNCSIYSIDINIMFDKLLENVPELTLPKGITWGSTANEIKKAYGEPNEEMRLDEYGCTYYYYFGENNERLILSVYDEYGVTGINYSLQ